MCAAVERWAVDAGLSPDVVCDVTPPSRLRLPSTSHAPRDARTFLNDNVCPLHTRPATIETAALLVSELVTNSVTHAAPPVELTVGCARAWLVVEVSDGSRDLPTGAEGDVPVLDATGELDEGGRGIPLVAALSSQWGAHPLASGKVTWFRLAL